MAHVVDSPIHFPFMTKKIVGWLLKPPGTHPAATCDTQWYCVPPCPTGHAAFTSQFLVKDSVKGRSKMAEE